HRGIVFGFWSAHSFGRFAGSAWYADTHWNDLRDNAVAYLHLDLNGLKGADRLWYQHMAELEDEQIDVLETHSGVPVDTDAGHEAEGAAQWEAEDRPGRAADQSFWGAGLSSVFCGLRLESGTPTGGPIGGGWWWHTAEDTRDKVDTDVLVEETGLYVALVSRICGSAILPHDFSSTVRDFESTIDEIESVARGEAAFDELRGALDELGRNLEIATDLLVEEARRSTGVFRPGEDLQVRLGNLLIPALYMDRQDTEHEPALPHRLLPCLRPAETLPDLSGPQRRFAEVGLTRSRAKLLHRLSRANEAVEGFIRSHQDQ
ncbi:MAG: hypothetical protein R3324_06530, partial [Halobacteriales archaeon]|nr:hypothetical protein [Halobacteriales archaeon]